MQHIKKILAKRLHPNFDRHIKSTLWMIGGLVIVIIFLISVLSEWKTIREIRANQNPSPAVFSSQTS